MDTKQKEALEVISRAREAVLATLEDGKPFTSAVNCFYLPQEKWGKMIMLMSELARHTKNANKNPEVSLQILESSSLPLYQRKRVSLQGNLSPVKDSAVFESHKKHYLELFPEAEIFFKLSDFKFYELEINELYFIGGFGKIESIK